MDSVAMPNDTQPTSVYKFYDKFDILIYVGVTNGGLRRNQQHNSDKEWWAFVARQEIEHYETRPLALARERALIRKHEPPFNVQHNPHHTQLRAAYLALDFPRDPSTFHVQHALSLKIRKQGHGLISFVTQPGDAAIIEKVVCESPGKTSTIPITFNHGLVCGLIRKMESQGPYLSLNGDHKQKASIAASASLYLKGIDGVKDKLKVKRVEINFAGGN